MIELINKTSFPIPNEVEVLNWLKRVIESEGKEMGDLTYSFVNDAELDQLNQEYLNHTDYTDIISFDLCVGNIVSGDIFISVERVKENAEKYGVSYEEELKRVMVHGVLHYCGYQDFSEEEQKKMRTKENEKLEMFHVEQ